MKNTKERFNKRTEFRGKMHTYDNILLENVRNLAKYIENNERALEFDIPKVEISRNDNTEAREEFGIKYRSTLKKIRDRIRKELRL